MPRTFKFLNNLAAIQNGSGLGTKEMAEKIGVSPSNYVRLRKVKPGELRFRTAIRVADALGVTLEEVFPVRVKGRR